MKAISPKDFKEILSQNPTIIDVREPDEFKHKRISGSTNIPLSELAGRIAEIPKDRPVYFFCRTGRRSGMAVMSFAKAGFSNGVNVTGGIVAQSSLKTNLISERKILPVIQQVQIIASFMIFLGLSLGLSVNPYFLILTVMPGFGLALAGFTGFCPMAWLLEQLPYNKVNHPNQEFQS